MSEWRKWTVAELRTLPEGTELLIRAKPPDIGTLVGAVVKGGNVYFPGVYTYSLNSDADYPWNGEVCVEKNWKVWKVEDLKNLPLGTMIYAPWKEMIGTVQTYRGDKILMFPDGSGNTFLTQIWPWNRAIQVFPVKPPEPEWRRWTVEELRKLPIGTRIDIQGVDKSKTFSGRVEGGIYTGEILLRLDDGHAMGFGSSNGYPWHQPVRVHDNNVLMVPREPSPPIDCAVSDAERTDAIIKEIYASQEPFARQYVQQQIQYVIDHNFPSMPGGWRNVQT